MRQIMLTDSVAPLEQCRGHILLLFAEQSISQQVTLPRMLRSLAAGSTGTTTLCIGGRRECLVSHWNPRCLQMWLQTAIFALVSISAMYSFTSEESKTCAV